MAKEKGRGAEQERESLSSALLDSSLIQQTNTIKYNAKIIVCGDYIQLYLYDHYLIRKDNNLSPIGYEKKRVVIDRKASNKFKYYEVRSDNAYR
jgi:hypothetical protein